MDESKKSALPEGASVSLSILEGPGSGRRYQVSELPLVIGSSAAADLRLESEGVADRHARLLLAGRELFIEHIAESGATMVNTRPVQRSKVENSDIVELGPVKLLVHISLPPPEGRISPSGSDEKIRAEEKEEPRESAGKKPFREVWAAGFSPSFREWFENELAKTLKLKTRAFRNGEEVLEAMSRSLAEDREPSLLLLDLRLPFINGINVAIATRAFELGYKKETKVPIVFLFEPPRQASFDKVVNFCQPLRLEAPGNSEEELRVAVRKAIKGARR